MKFNFDTFSNEKTKQAYFDLNQNTFDGENIKLGVQMRLTNAKAKFIYSVEQYLVAVGLIKVNPLNHNAGLDFKPEEETWYYHECSSDESDHDVKKPVASHADHPELSKLWNEYTGYVKEQRSQTDKVLETHAKNHKAAWDIIFSVMATHGLIEKDANGEYPRMVMEDRFVHPHEEEESGSDLMSMIKKIVGNRK